MIAAPRSALHRRLAWAFVGFYMGVIFYLSHQPSLPVPMRFPHQDKVFHFLAYFVLAALFIHAFTEGSRKRRFLVAFAAACLYGVSDEIHQSFVPGRDASVLDWLADALGAWIGCFLYLSARNPLKKPS